MDLVWDRIPLVVLDVGSLIKDFVSLEPPNVIGVVKRGIYLGSVQIWKGWLLNKLG